MNDFLNKIRSKPDNVKKNFALLGAGLVTFLIVGTWMLVIKNEKTEKVVKERSVSEDIKPLVLIFKNAKEGISNMRQEAKGVMNFKANIIESVDNNSKTGEEENIDTSKDFIIVE